MLNHAPNSSRPPDPRPRPRSYKPKNGAKRQPQRGLGVAQLEKLRLEEQSKQQEDAVCLNSLQQQRHHHGYLQFNQQQEIKFPQQLHLFHPCHSPQEQQRFQLQHQTPPSLCVSSQMKLMDTPPASFYESRFPNLSMAGSGGVANLQNSFLSLAGMSDRGPLSPLLISPQNESESITLPRMGQRSSNLTSQGPCIANYGREILWHNHHNLTRAPIREKGSTSSSTCLGTTDVEMQAQEVSDTFQCLDWDRSSTSENANAVSEYRHGGVPTSLHLSVGKLRVQNDMAPLTDLCLRPMLVGVADVHASQRPHRELPVIGDGVLTSELSSFQTISLRPTWLPPDRVSNKKRPWGCTQELVAEAGASRGLDLNIGADEFDFETSEPNIDMPVPSSIRGSSTQGSAQRQSENNVKARLKDKTCNEVCSPVAEATDSDVGANSDDFPSLRKMSLQVETSVEFLTLGSSYSSLQICRHLCGDCNDSPLLTESSEKASSSQPPELLYRGEHFSFPLNLAENDEIMLPLDDRQTSYLCASLQRNVELTDSSCNEVRGPYQQCGDDQMLDLELRLSL